MIAGHASSGSAHAVGRGGETSNCDCQAVGPLAADKAATGVLVNNNALFGTVVSDEAAIPYDDGSGYRLTDATVTNISGTLDGDSGHHSAMPHTALALVTTPSTTSTVMRLFRCSDVCHSIS
jgi:hypothetical protein